MNQQGMHSSYSTDELHSAAKKYPKRSYRYIQSTYGTLNQQQFAVVQQCI